MNPCSDRGHVTVLDGADACCLSAAPKAPDQTLDSADALRDALVAGPDRPQALVPVHSVLAGLLIQVPWPPLAVCTGQSARLSNY